MNHTHNETRPVLEKIAMILDVIGDGMQRPGAPVRTPEEQEADRITGRILLACSAAIEAINRGGREAATAATGHVNHAIDLARLYAAKRCGVTP
jgi:hypothetical protein